MALTRTEQNGKAKLELKCDISGCDRETVMIVPPGPIREVWPKDGPEWILIQRNSEGASPEMFAACPLHEFGG